MKKKIFGAVVVVAIAVGAMINVNLNKVSNNSGDLALANVEALAQYMETPSGIICHYDPNSSCYFSTVSNTWRPGRQ